MCVKRHRRGVSEFAIHQRDFGVSLVCLIYFLASLLFYEMSFLFWWVASLICFVLFCLVFIAVGSHLL